MLEFESTHSATHSSYKVMSNTGVVDALPVLGVPAVVTHLYQRAISKCETQDAGWSQVVQEAGGLP